MPRKKSSKEKGRVFEKLAASMYDFPGVKVERNVRLPVRKVVGKKKRTREIDILVTGTMAGVPIRIPIECKNYNDKKIGVKLVDGFIGELADVGLPPSPAIFISATGFTQDALDRAAEAGMLTRVLKEVTRDSGPQLINSALQRIVFLLAQVTELQWQDAVEDYRGVMETARDAFFAFAFFDGDDRFVGMVPDLIWRKWLDGEPASLIGEHELSYEIPKGWGRYVKGRREPLLSLKAKIRVVGLAVSLPGSTHSHTLVDPTTGEIERSQLSASFTGPHSRMPVQTFGSEESLERYLEEHATGQVVVSVGRFRLPRILMKGAYWPLSQKTRKRIQELAEEHGEIPADFSLSEIEGDSLNAVWDPILPGYPGAEP